MEGYGEEYEAEGPETCKVRLFRGNECN